MYASRLLSVCAVTIASFTAQALLAQNSGAGAGKSKDSYTQQSSASAEVSATERGEASPSAKISTATGDARRVSQTSDRPKPVRGVSKTANASLRARDQANDYWTTPFGGFHLFGDDGRAVYRYPAEPSGGGYDTHWVFVDDLPVGTRSGWTYKEDGYEFYMFFAKNSDANGKFWVGWSFNNVDFFFYQWAD